MGLSFPLDFLVKILVDLQEDPSDNTEEAVLIYENLVTIISIYMNMPFFLRGDSNNSQNVKEAFQYMSIFNPSKFDRVDKLMKYITTRIEEKFKDFRQAYRAFDKNFDGGLSFKEVI